jgi:glycosyltransferase 2 family protein
MRTLKLVLKILVTLLLLTWLIGRVEWATVGHILAGAAWPLLGFYLGFQLLGTLISASKWRFLGRLSGYHFSLKDAFFSYLTGAFINNFLPSTIGGDTYRTLWMGTGPGGRMEAATVVIFDRITGLLGLIIFVGVGFFFVPSTAYVAAPWLVIFAASLLAIIVWTILAFLFVERFFLFAEMVARLFPGERPAVFVRRFAPLARLESSFASLGYSLLFVAVGVGCSNWFLFEALGADLGLGAYIGAIFLATLVANIPLSINTIGVKEWSYVFFFGLVGVSAELAVTAALLSRFLQMLLSFIALPRYLATRSQEVFVTGVPRP